ncbi:hypothetical protein NDU88_002749 [Pleurodeles waltl]|uniref:Uncharacterized protein n=1 Tax=Pleurodeles waltl TaxID=8319 RepID=A0AAV7UD97_PLEWA|nr:hypothetical protein NDU88_002749 [Pleurodeles waltl]
MQLLAEGTGLLRGSVGTLRTQGQWTGLRGSAVPALAGEGDAKVDRRREACPSKNSLHSQGQTIWNATWDTVYPKGPRYTGPVNYTLLGTEAHAARQFQRQSNTVTLH